MLKPNKYYVSSFLVLGVVCIGLVLGNLNRVEASLCSTEVLVETIISSARPNMGPLEKEFWVKAITQVSNKHGLSPPVVAAKIRVESGFTGHKTSHKGAKGASQLMPMWTKSFDPFEIEANLDKGAEVLAIELKASKGDIYRALRRYNGGGPDGEKMKDTIIYADKVLAIVAHATIKNCPTMFKVNK